MNINNNNPSGNAASANSVENNNTAESETSISNQINYITNVAIVLATLTLAFLGAGLALMFVGAPAVAFMPFFIAAGITGLLLVAVAPFANSEAKYLEEDERINALQEQEAANTQDTREETPTTSASTNTENNENEEQQSPQNQENNEPRLRFGSTSREPEEEGQAEPEEIRYSTKF